MKDSRRSYLLPVSVSHNVVAPSSGAWSASQMEMRSQAIQLPFNVGFINTLDSDVKHFAVLLETAGNNRTGISRVHIQYDNPDQKPARVAVLRRIIN